ncbi:MAG: alkaline phosphatase family protein, partial [Phycisphaerae bacterium]|nr:alkaline phosphatase family protein [Phycisphaerae bacterium]
RTHRTAIRPQLPAVTMPVQATFTTGVDPSDHGIIANGLPTWRLPEVRSALDLASYVPYRSKVSFWEQSNQLLTAPRVWTKDGRKVALLFVQSSMQGAADIVVTPKPEHTADGRMIPKCWTDPPDLHKRLTAELGPFPLQNYWGPAAGMDSSAWIIKAAIRVWQWEMADLQFVYVPQLDYDLQRLGPDDPAVIESIYQVLDLLTPMFQAAKEGGARVLILSEYGMTAVDRSVAPNAHLRAAGLLEVNAAGEVDYDASAVFALCDHQVAHVYCRDAESIDEAESLLSALEEVHLVYRGAQRAEIGLDSPRSGDLVVFSHADAWFEYRWWDDWTQAPDYAWEVDIHRKPGYDPTELFWDPQGKRIHADRPQMVKGSHGAFPPDQADWPVLIGRPRAPDTCTAAEIANMI